MSYDQTSADLLSENEKVTRDSVLKEFSTQTQMYNLDGTPDFVAREYHTFSMADEIVTLRTTLAAVEAREKEHARTIQGLNEARLTAQQNEKGARGLADYWRGRADLFAKKLDCSPNEEEYDIDLHIKWMVEKQVEKALQKYADLVAWLLGENGDFPAGPERDLGKPYSFYWWRSELRRRHDAIRTALADADAGEGVSDA